MYIIYRQIHLFLYFARIYHNQFRNEPHLFAREPPKLINSRGRLERRAQGAWLQVAIAAAVNFIHAYDTLQ